MVRPALEQELRAMAGWLSLTDIVVARRSGLDLPLKP
jgi:hypothetical protein